MLPKVATCKRSIHLNLSLNEPPVPNALIRQSNINDRSVTQTNNSNLINTSVGLVGGQGASKNVLDMIGELNSLSDEVIAASPVSEISG